MLKSEPRLPWKPLLHSNIPRFRFGKRLQFKGLELIATYVARSNNFLIFCQYYNI